MISILPSEGLAPSASKPHKPSDNSANSDDPSFSSFVSRNSADASKDPRSDQASSDPSQGAPADQNEISTSASGDAGLDRPTQVDPKLSSAENTEVKVADADIVRDALQGDGETTPAVDAAPEGQAAAKSGLAAGQEKFSDADAPAIRRRAQSTTAAAEQAQATTTADSRVSADADLAASGHQRGDTDAQTVDTRAKAHAPNGSATAEQAQGAAKTTAAAATSTNDSRLSADADLDAKIKASGDAAGNTSPPQAGRAPTEHGDDVLRVTRGQDTANLTDRETRATQLTSPADFATATTKAMMAGAATDASMTAAATTLPDSVLSIGQSQSVVPTVTTSGLTPVAPSVPIAAPSEINSIILNALKGGAEPQEQLIVQLDPPELGRVAIDFKFDAQGLQQITVTSENPEALKRLRELHFELTEALKDHGLSEKNLSFRQQADDQSQPAWQMPERTGAGAVLSSAEETQAVARILRSNANYTAADRLDLTL